MKKLFAVLVACLLTIGTFISCKMPQQPVIDTRTCYNIESISILNLMDIIFLGKKYANIITYDPSHKEESITFPMDVIIYNRNECSLALKKDYIPDENVKTLILGIEIKLDIENSTFLMDFLSFDLEKKTMKEINVKDSIKYITFK